MTAEKFVKELGIEKSGEWTDENNYVVDLDDSNEWGKFFTVLDNSEVLEQEDENQTLTKDNSSLIFVSNEYTLNLQADFDGDVYQLVVTQN